MNDFWKAMNPDNEKDDNSPQGDAESIDLDDEKDLLSADEASFDEVTQEAVAPEATPETAARRRRHQKADYTPEAPVFEEDEKEGAQRKKWPFFVLGAAALIFLIMVIGGGGESVDGDDSTKLQRGQISDASNPDQAKKNDSDSSSDLNPNGIEFDFSSTENALPSDQELKEAVELLNRAIRQITAHDHAKALRDDKEAFAAHLGEHLNTQVQLDSQPTLGEVALYSLEGSRYLTVMTVANEEGYPLMRKVPLEHLPKWMQAQYMLQLEEVKKQRNGFVNKEVKEIRVALERYFKEQQRANTKLDIQIAKIRKQRQQNKIQIKRIQEQAKKDRQRIKEFRENGQS
jgi:hypothetical protein